ncbi:unnamed protein product, partial [Ixodes hexagonus]
ESLLPDGDEKQHATISLPHPKTGAASLFLRSDAGQYFEITKFKEKFRSWFLGDTVESDGSLYIVTPMDPLFFALALMQKSDKYRPLEDFAEDNKFPTLLNVLKCCEEHVRHIADVKDLGDDKVYRHNEAKALVWLEKKVAAVAGVLKARDVTVGASCKSSALVRSKKDSRPTEQDYLTTAHSIVADYVSPELGARLKSSMKLDTKTESPIEKTPEAPPAKKLKGAERVQPVEDYSKDVPKNARGAATPKLTASQRKLQKVDKTGMKSISSFFAKKGS